MRKAPIREVYYCYHGTLVWLKSRELQANLPPHPTCPNAPPSLSPSTPCTCPGGVSERLVEHIHERCSKQGWRDTSSWMPGSGEEALKLAPAWGAEPGERGWGGGWKASKENEGESRVGEEECREAEVGGEGGDSTRLLRRLSAHSLGCGKLNV